MWLNTAYCGFGARGLLTELARAESLFPFPSFSLASVGARGRKLGKNKDPTSKLHEAWEEVDS